MKILQDAGGWWSEEKKAQIAGKPGYKKMASYGAAGMLC
jgi:hypothetical protein